MKDRFRWLPFLLVNIFVSAAVTGAILFWYDRTYRQAEIPSVLPNPAVEADAPPAEPAELSPDIDVNMVSVIGAGTLDAEVVSIRYSGDSELNLTGWHLEDEDKNVFVFPQLSLYSGGVVQVHSETGQDSVIALYWNSRDPIWESGEEASLLDSQGNVRATYVVP